MQRLNLPACDLRVKNSENKIWVFDVVRKKFVVLQPEEWVRQHVVHYLIGHKGYPLSLINVEKQLLVNGLRKRYDIVIFKPDGSIHLLVECKAPAIRISQSVFDQVARYNMPLGSSYLMVTNGMDHFCCQMDMVQEKYTFLPQIPDFSR